MRLLALIMIAGVSACGPSVGGDDEGNGEGDSTTGAADDGSSMSAESAGPTTAPVDTGDDGVMTTPATNGDDADEDDTADTGEKLDIAAVCDFEEIVRDAAMGSKLPPVDCGFVTLADDGEAWRAAHQCAIEAFASQSAAVVLWELQGTDSTLYGAMVGFVGEAYAITEYGYDSWGGPIMWSHGCDAVVTLDDCIVGTGEICLTCQGAGDQTPICG